MKLPSSALFALLMSVALPAAAESNIAKQESLLGVRVASKGIAYYVYSGGCTRKSDFEVQILESYPVQLKLVRVRPDHCKGLVPDGEEIFFTWDEMGLTKGTPFKVVNPLQTFIVP